MKLHKYSTLLALMACLLSPPLSAEEAAVLDAADAEILSPKSGHSCTISGIVSEVVAADGHFDVKFEGDVFTLRVAQKQADVLEESFAADLAAHLTGGTAKVTGKLLGRPPSFGMILETAEDLEVERAEDLEVEKSAESSEPVVLKTKNLEKIRKHLGETISLDGKVAELWGESPTRNISFGDNGLFVAIPEEMLEAVTEELGGELEQTIQGERIHVQGVLSETTPEGDEEKKLKILITEPTDIKMDTPPASLKEPTEVVKAKDDRRLEKIVEELNWIAVEGEVDEVTISDSGRCNIYYKRSIIKVTLASDQIDQVLELCGVADVEDFPDFLQGEDLRLVGELTMPKEDVEMQIKDVRQFILMKPAK